MVRILAYIDRNIWAKGELREPKLTVYFTPMADRSYTVIVALYDYNGVKVTDDYSTTVGERALATIIELGDYLDAQQTAKGFGSGFYIIMVKIVETGEVFALPLIVTLGYFTPPPMTDMEYLQYYTIFDKALGTYINLPPTIPYLPSDPRFMVYAYFHKGNKGRLVGISEVGGIVFDTDYHQLTYITITLKFNSIKELLTHVFAHSYGGFSVTTMSSISSLIDAGDYDTALKLLRPYYMFTFLGRTITVDFDTANYEIRIKTQVYLGQWDWGKIFGWGAIGCGASILGVMVLTALTAGVGAITAPLVAGACVAGGVLGAGVAVVTSMSSDKPETYKIYINKLLEEGEKAKQQNQQYYNDAKSILDSWLQQGKITQDEYNGLMKVLDTWKAGMDAAIDDIVKLSDEAIKKAYNDGYNEGYTKGVSEGRTWIAVSGLIGFLIGALISR
jgi:hypothetical protein